MRDFFDGQLNLYFFFRRLKRAKDTTCEFTLSNVAGGLWTDTSIHRQDN